jgi:hypothetical protein
MILGAPRDDVSHFPDQVCWPLDACRAAGHPSPPHAPSQVPDAGCLAHRSLSHLNAPAIQARALVSLDFIISLDHKHCFHHVRHSAWLHLTQRDHHSLRVASTQQPMPFDPLVFCFYFCWRRAFLHVVVARRNVHSVDCSAL